MKPRVAMRLTFRGGPLDGQTLDSETKGIRNSIPCEVVPRNLYRLIDKTVTATGATYMYVLRTTDSPYIQRVSQSHAAV